jgi:hypothetical protein
VADLRALAPIASGVLTGVATQILVSAPGWTVRKLRRSREGDALVKIVANAVGLSFADASVSPEGDLAWVEAVAREWQPAFTPAVCAQLLATLSGAVDAGTFRAAALRALRDAGADPAELGRVIDVDEFLHIAPRRVFTGLRTAALAPDSVVRGIVGALLQQETAPAVEAALNQASPREFRRDMEALLSAIEEQALSGTMPGFLPARADVMTLTRTIRVRTVVEIAEKSLGNGAAEPGPYGLLAEPTSGGVPGAAGWLSVGERESRVVVLGDAGTGKSWLIRWETARLARAALGALRSGAAAGRRAVPGADAL